MKWFEEKTTVLKTETYRYNTRCGNQRAQLTKNSLFFEYDLAEFQLCKITKFLSRLTTKTRDIFLIPVRKTSLIFSFT